MQINLTPREHAAIRDAIQEVKDTQHQLETLPIRLQQKADALRERFNTILTLRDEDPAEWQLHFEGAPDKFKIVHIKEAPVAQG